MFSITCTRKAKSWHPEKSSMISRPPKATADKDKYAENKATMKIMMTLPINDLRSSGKIAYTTKVRTRKMLEMVQQMG